MNAPRIVVGLDTDTTASVLDWAAREATLRHSVIHLVHAWDPLGRNSFDAASALLLTAEHQLSEVEHVTSETMSGDAGHILTALSTTASLLVIGSSRLQGNGGLLLGSVAQHCVRQAHCPVTVVPMGWRTPRATSSELAGAPA